MPSDLSGDKETPKTCYEMPRPMEWNFFPRIVNWARLKRHKQAKNDDDDGGWVR